MKVIVAGGRDFSDRELLYTSLDAFHKGTPITEVVCGGARGADELGRCWADKNRITVTPMDAEWDKYGKTAGFIRNKQMGDYADYLIAFWNEKCIVSHIKQSTENYLAARLLFHI